MNASTSPVTGINATDPPAGTEPSPAQLRELFHAIHKSLKIRKLYKADGKPYQDAVEDLQGKLSSYLEEHENLTVIVTLEEFVAGEEAHLKSPKREGSIPFKLFRDGIRSIRFARGLSVPEVRCFLDVLDFEVDAPGNLDEDMATIFWKQDFHSIEITVIDELGTLGAGEGGGGDDTGGKGALGGGVEGVMESLKGCELFVCEGGGVVRFAQESGDHLVAAEERDFFEMERLAMKAIQAETGDDLLEVRESVVDSLRQELEEDARGAILTRVVDIVANLLTYGQSSLSSAELRILLFNLSQALLGKGDIADVNCLISKLDTLPHARAEPHANEALSGLLADLSSFAAVSLLFAVSCTGEKSSVSQLETLVTRLPASALEPCAKQLGALRPGLKRDTCLRLLKARGHENPGALMTYLEQVGGDEAVEDLRSILKARDIPGVAAALRKLLQHDEERGRIDAARVITAVAPGHRRALIELGLADSSNKVRIVSLRSAEQTGDLALVPVLRARHDACNKHDEDERTRILHTIATIGGKEAVACLREILYPRKSWIMGVLHSPWAPAEKLRKSFAIRMRDITDPAVRQLLGEDSPATKSLREDP